MTTSVGNSIGIGFANAIGSASSYSFGSPSGIGFANAISMGNSHVGGGTSVGHAKVSGIGEGIINASSDYISVPAVKFFPLWLAPNGILDTLLQNQTVDTSLNAYEGGIVMGSSLSCQQIGSITDITVPNPDNITTVKINGVQVVFYATETSIEFTHQLQFTDVIEIITSNQIIFSLHYGSLPPGLSMDNLGNITGTVGEIGANSAYTFGVRISNGILNSDSEFSFNVIPPTSPPEPPAWGRMAVSKTPDGVTYYPFGTASYGVPFSAQIVLYEPGGAPYLTTGEVTNIENVTAPFNLIVPGLSLDTRSGVFSGIIDPTVQPGQYFFTVSMNDSLNNPITVGSGAFPIIGMIEVYSPTAILTPIQTIIW